MDSSPTTSWLATQPPPIILLQSSGLDFKFEASSYLTNGPKTCLLLITPTPPEPK
jgi:hypothetical protein